MLLAWSRPAWLEWMPWPSAAWWHALWENTQYGIVWTITGLLLLIGLLGTVIPLLPGTVLILVAAAWHAAAMRWWVHADDPGIGWPGLFILALLVLLSQVLEMVSSALGAKYFGSSRWGAWGALAGGLIGIFFGIAGIFLGPVLGALAAELAIARRELKPAAKSTWGTLLGTVTGLLLKVGIGLVMAGYFFLDVLALRW